MPGTRRTIINRDRIPHVTPEMMKAWREKDYHSLHLAIGWKPWAVSPFHVHERPEPDPDTLQGHPMAIYLSTWWEAKRWRDALELACSKEDAAHREAKREVRSRKVEAERET